MHAYLDTLALAYTPNIPKIIHKEKKTESIWDPFFTQYYYSSYKRALCIVANTTKSHTTHTHIFLLAAAPKVLLCFCMQVKSNGENEQARRKWNEPSWVMLLFCHCWIATAGMGLCAHWKSRKSHFAFAPLCWSIRSLYQYRDVCFDGISSIISFHFLRSIKTTRLNPGYFTVVVAFTGGISCILWKGKNRVIRFYKIQATISCK